MSASQKADQYSLNDFVLSDNNFADFIRHRFNALCRSRKITHNVILCKKERLCLSF